eukprot:4613787-Amphidinium_carterae.1
MFSDPSHFFADLFQWIGVPIPPQKFYDPAFVSGRRRYAEKLKDRYHNHPKMLACKARLEKSVNRTFNWTGAPNSCESSGVAADPKL